MEMIGTNAFRHCRNLESVNIPKSLRLAARGIFWDCPRLPRTISRNKVFNPLHWYGDREERERLEELCPLRSFLQDQAEDSERYLKEAGELRWRKVRLSEEYFYHDFQDNGSFEEISIYVFTFFENEILDEPESALLQCGIMISLLGSHHKPQDYDYYASLWETMTPDQRRKAAREFSERVSYAYLHLLSAGELTEDVKSFVCSTSYIDKIRETLAPYNEIPFIVIDYGDDLETACFWLGLQDNRIILVDLYFIMPN